MHINFNLFRIEKHKNKETCVVYAFILRRKKEHYTTYHKMQCLLDVWYCLLNSHERAISLYHILHTVLSDRSQKYQIRQ